MKNLFEKLGIKYPIIQAPMAGISTPKFVAAASNAGCLGSYGVGLISVEQMKSEIKSIQSLTKQPFHVNIFSLQDCNNVNMEQCHFIDHKLLNPIRDKIGIPKIIHRSTINGTSLTNAHIDVLLELKPHVTSFCFGLLSKDTIKQLQNFSIVLGTATSLQEAIILEEYGVDGIIAQGNEAGGHRGTFLSQQSNDIGTMALLPLIVHNVTIPVYAAGGIMNGQGIIAAQALGASGVSMGTAFLTCHESSASFEHQQAILNATQYHIGTTRAFSGKLVRGIRNKFFEEMECYQDQIPPFYQVQGVLTSDIRKHGGFDYSSLWCGQAASLARKNLTISELLKQLKEEMNHAQLNIASKL